MTKSSVLICGSNGQLGNELKCIFENNNSFNFIFTDFEELDITKNDKVVDFVNKSKPSFIINCAAYTNVDKCETDVENAFLLNSKAPQYLAEAANMVSAKLIHISTDYVFDGNAYKPLKEDDVTNPETVYGRSKLEGEKNIINTAKNGVIIRTSWLYSSFGNNFVKTMLSLAKQQKSLQVVFDQVGTPTYARDLALLIEKFIENPQHINGVEVYHYSNEGVASWYDFTKSIFEISNIQINVYPVTSDKFPRPAKRPNYSVLDKTKIKEKLNIEIPYWKNSLIECLKHLDKKCLNISH